MEEVSIFVFGQTQEQIESKYNYTSEANRDMYGKLREFIYERSIKQGKFLNLYTSGDRGLGFTVITTGISLKNEFDGIVPLTSIHVINPAETLTRGWGYKEMMKFDELISFVDSNRNASRGELKEGWVKAGKAMADSCEIGIIMTPESKVGYISEVMRYALNRNMELYRYNEETKEFAEVTMVDVMTY